jgi:enoyl-CoA hydratase/carnithine racemase
MAVDVDPGKRMGNLSAFKPLSGRLGKPVIAAVNGLAMGGGTEFVVNYDLVTAANSAYFGLPEVKRGLTPIRGALPRLIRTIGLQRSSEFALTGRNITAQETFTWGLVNKAVPQAEVVNEAVRYAAMIAVNNPDAVVCTWASLRQGSKTAAVEQAVEIRWSESLQNCRKVRIH